MKRHSKDPTPNNSLGTLDHKQRGSTSKGDAIEKRIKAEYSPGRKPIIQDLGESDDGYIRLANNSRISVDWLRDLQYRAHTVILTSKTKRELFTKTLYSEDKWNSFAHREKCLRGMGLAYLTIKRLVPLVCKNPDKSGTRKYRFK